MADIREMFMQFERRSDTAADSNCSNELADDNPESCNIGASTSTDSTRSPQKKKSKQRDQELVQTSRINVSIYMPSLKVVRNVVDRMKNLSSHVVISANQNGYMTLGVDTDLVKATTHFKHLDSPRWEEEAPSSQTNRDPNAMAEARVDIKKLATFLISQQVGPTRVICTAQKKGKTNIVERIKALQNDAPRILQYKREPTRDFLCFMC